MTTYTLTDADFDAIKDTCNLEVFYNEEIAVADVAFALGIERGKAEREKYQFICDRCGLRQDPPKTGETPF